MSREDLMPRLLESLFNNQQTPRQRAIVDIGCGSGASVGLLYKSGYDAYGCDVKFKNGYVEGIEVLASEKRLRTIEQHPYRLPFEDDFADVTFSDQVVEHVSDLDLFFQEVSRITKPGGVSCHYFPCINKLIEPHVRIPLATRIQWKWWILAWSRSPSRRFPRPDWKKRGGKEMYEYLKRSTSYRSNS